MRRRNRRQILKILQKGCEIKASSQHHNHLGAKKSFLRMKILAVVRLNKRFYAV